MSWLERSPFDTAGFPPRWRCGSWSDLHGWTHILSDIGIAGAYFAIPVLITLYLIRKRDVPFPPVVWLFAAFILSCGIGHAIEAIIFWHPVYRLAGLVKLVTAIVSWVTVFALLPLIPKALKLPGMAAVNRQLRDEIARRERAEAERRAIETQMQQAQKLESLGLLAGGIAHDFNNILTGVMGYVDLARREAVSGSTQEKYLDEAVANCQRAADVAKQMLAYSGKGRFVVGPVDLSALVENSRPLLSVSAAKGCTLAYDLAPRLPAIEADTTQLQQVLLNLVINASEAIGDRTGTVTIRTAVRDCSADDLAVDYADDRHPPGRYVEWTVADTGTGMTAEVRARIFDPFFSTKFTGRGLGLAAVLGIVRGHRGTLTVDSEPGRGSTFRILLPALAATPPAATPVPASTVDRSTSGRVLLIDDEDSVRAVAKVMLERLGYAVTAAATGPDGLELARAAAGSWSFAVVDLTMPGLNGLETATDLRRIQPGLKILLASGYDEAELAEGKAESPPDAFLQKPYALRELRVAIRALSLPNA
jgi:signal transduction histidine kinase/CheY-like chemotaxis protein